MKGLTIFNRSSRTEGKIKIRFRLRDGRGVDLYYKSNIETDLRDLAKFTDSGDVKPKVKVYDTDLKYQIDDAVKAIEQAYYDLCERKPKETISNAEFNAAVEEILHPKVDVKKSSEPSLLQGFLSYIEGGLRDGLFGVKRKAHYMVAHEILRRFLVVTRQTRIKSSDFTNSHVLDFRDFVFNEYKYVARYPRLYEDISKNNLPVKVRSQNTVSTKMKMLQAYFNDLMGKGEIQISPFLKIGKNRKRVMMQERYDPPIALTRDEVRKLINAVLPESMQEVRDCFLLQCALGCRISDFVKLSMEKVSVTPDGIPYVHYLPEKTRNSNVGYEEVQTPLMLFALNIIKKWNFHFPILKYVTGKSGYNMKIRQLLEMCGIDRECQVFDEEKGDNVFKPLYSLGSSKLCRKTNVDIMKQAQVNLYAAGLHKTGSDAVHHYTHLTMKDRFTLMCYAFGEPMYIADKELNITLDAD